MTTPSKDIPAHIATQAALIPPTDTYTLYEKLSTLQAMAQSLESINTDGVRPMIYPNTAPKTPTPRAPSIQALCEDAPTFDAITRYFKVPKVIDAWAALAA